MQLVTHKNRVLKKMLLSLVLAWGLTLIAMPSVAKPTANLQISNENNVSQNVEMTNALKELAANFKKAPNQMSPVTITNFSPLSTAVAGRAQTFIGFALLTQDDAAMSAGVGATFKF